MFTPARDERMGMGGGTHSSAMPETVIARGVRIEGEFNANGNVVIEGEVIGSLSCSGHLTVGAEALIKAGVRAQQATISGRIEGEVHVSQRLEIKANATILGNITAQQMAVESGASLNGQVQVGSIREQSEPVVINTPINVLESEEV